MVYLAKAMCKANEQTAPSTELDQEGLLASTEGVTTVAEAAVALGLQTVVPEEQQLPLAEFLAELPPAIDAAMVAAARDAVQRGVRVTFTWQPGYAYELRIWDVSDDDADVDNKGMVNLHLVSPHPDEAQSQS